MAAPLVKLPYVLISRKEIRRPEDLPGKSIGIARAGNISERLSKAVVKKFNIPENEVAAFAEAVRFVEKNPAKGKVAVAKVMRTNEAEALQSSYDVYAKEIVDRRMIIPEKAVADTIEQTRLAGGVVRRKSDDLFDNSHTVHLGKSGFLKELCGSELGAPAR
ncbi:MAG: ABC transporter substrate-binding protein [Candidatus Binatia bacterium]